MEKIKKSSFGLSSFTVTEFHITRKPLNQTKGLLTIKPSGFYSRETKKFTLLLDVSIKDEKESFKIDMSTIGLFNFQGNVTEKELSNYFLTNAPAIIFPYVRAYISSVTALSGLTTVNLPVMNLTALRSELKNKIQEIEIVPGTIK